MCDSSAIADFKLLNLLSNFAKELKLRSFEIFAFRSNGYVI